MCFTDQFKNSLLKHEERKKDIKTDKRQKERQ